MRRSSIPWDKRLGYPYGIRASAESSGSMVDPYSYKRWFGWFIMSGLERLRQLH